MAICKSGWRDIFRATNVDPTGRTATGAPIMQGKALINNNQWGFSKADHAQYVTLMVGVEPTFKNPLEVNIQDPANINPIAPAATDDISDAKGLLLFGSDTDMGSDDQAVYFDLLGGAPLSFVARENMSLRIVYPLAPAGAGITQPAIIVRASLGIGSRTSQSSTGGARFTIKIPNLAQGVNASAPFLIPIWALSAVASNVQGGATPNDGLRLQQFLDLGGTVAVGDAPILKTEGTLVPRIAGAQSFRLVNTNGGLASTTNSVSWYLGL